jgi:hypothetical protein
VGYAVAILICFLVMRKSGSATKMIAFVAIVLTLVVVIDPVAEPQFVVWLLPLFVVVAFAWRDSIVLLLTYAVAFVNLLSFLRSENPYVWYLNAVPPGTRTPGLWRAPNGFTDPTAAVRLARGYLALLVVCLLLTLLALFRKAPSKTRLSRRAWRVAVLGSLAVSVIACGFAVAVTFQPALTSAYANAPDHPVDFVRLNRYNPLDLKWSEDNASVVARFQKDNASSVTSAGDRAFVSATSEPVDPSLVRQAAGADTKVDSIGADVVFRLPEPAAAIQIRVLLGNEALSSSRRLKLPNVTFTAANEDLHIPVANLEPIASPTWEMLRLDISELLAPGYYRLHLSAPDQDGWFWNGGGMADQAAFTERAGKRMTTVNWITVWSAGTSQQIGKSQTTFTDDARIQVVISAPDAAELRSGYKIAMPANVSRSTLPLVQIGYNLEQDPWWMKHRLLAAGISIALIIILTLAIWVAYRLAEWAWRD